MEALRPGSPRGCGQLQNRRKSTVPGGFWGRNGAAPRDSWGGRGRISGSIDRGKRLWQPQFAPQMRTRALSAGPCRVSAGPWQEGLLLQALPKLSSFFSPARAPLVSELHLEALRGRSTLRGPEAGCSFQTPQKGKEEQGSEPKTPHNKVIVPTSCLSVDLQPTGV